MADDISPVNLPPIASIGDAPLHDSRRGSKDEKRRLKTQTNPKTKAPNKVAKAAANHLKAVKRNLHHPTLVSNPPSMNWTSSRNPNLVSKLPDRPSRHDARPLIEEVACVIAEAQAALFTGRIRDLEICIMRQQALCAELKSLPQENTIRPGDDPRELVATVQRVRQQNLIFGAVARRMRRHLETVRNLLNGLSLTYQPKPIKVPHREI